jgi:hypothetical protein
MTIEQIRQALTHMEENYGLAMDYKEYGLANAFKDKIDWLMAELDRRIDEHFDDIINSQAH